VGIEIEETKEEREKRARYLNSSYSWQAPPEADPMSRRPFVAPELTNGDIDDEQLVRHDQGVNGQSPITPEGKAQPKLRAINQYSALFSMSLV
jgi:hypothetical protein